MILFKFYKQIFKMLQNASDMFESKRITRTYFSFLKKVSIFEILYFPMLRACLDFTMSVEVWSFQKNILFSCIDWKLLGIILNNLHCCPHYFALKCTNMLYFIKCVYILLPFMFALDFIKYALNVDELSLGNHLYFNLTVFKSDS